VIARPVPGSPAWRLLELVTAEPGEWAPGLVRVGAIVVCGDLADPLGLPLAEVRELARRLREAGWLAPSRVRLVTMPRRVLGDLPLAILCRVAISPVDGLALGELATTLGRAKASGMPDGGLAEALDLLYAGGALAPPSALWPTPEAVALVLDEGRAAA
jgi:hypothetical protein